MSDVWYYQVDSISLIWKEHYKHNFYVGIVGIAKSSGETLVENEVLPQCWEQLSHKHVERRLLVAESCNALTPYVSVSETIF